MIKFAWCFITLIIAADVAQLCADEATGSEPAQVINIWPSIPPDFKPSESPEVDTSNESSGRVADRAVIRLGNVQTPQLHVFPAKGDNASTTTVVVCPGGGYSILAWDLEGTEVAEWLQSIGVTAVVLKYRVPTRNEQRSWLAPVQDIQRSIEMVRGGEVEGVKAERVGVLGFSAGGNAAALAATATRKYFEIDGDAKSPARTIPDDRTIDAESVKQVKPDFAVLVYPAWLVREDAPHQLIDDVTVDATTPPMFFAHARNDRVTCMSSVTLFAELQKNDIPAALHVFADGGHGFGLREVGEAHNRWPQLCEDWMRERGWLK